MPIMIDRFGTPISGCGQRPGSNWQGWLALILTIIAVTMSFTTAAGAAGRFDSNVVHGFPRANAEALLRIL